MNDVFLDTVGLLALWDKSDQWHTAAASAFELIQTERPPVYTTTYTFWRNVAMPQRDVHIDSPWTACVSSLRQARNWLYQRSKIGQMLGMRIAKDKLLQLVLSIKCQSQ